MPLSLLRSAREDALSPEEAFRLFDVCWDLLDSLVCKIPYFTGMRIGEIQHMRDTWLDWEQSMVNIPARQICGCYECRKWRNGVWTPKTKAGIRSLIITPEIEPYLHDMGEGINRTRQALEKRFQRVLRRSGLMKKAYPHCLRASFATRLAEQGISAPSLTYLLGWETLSPAESYIQSSRRRAHEEFREIRSR